MKEISAKMGFKKIILLMFYAFPALAQWEAGSSFNYKNEIPGTGFGIFVSRNLPVQFSSFGIKTRIGFDYFLSDGESDNLNADLHADIVAILFYQNVQPYFGLSFGGSRYSVNDFDEYIFFLGSLAGIKFPVTSWLHPFVEIYSNKYFSDFDEQKTIQSISSVQIAGRAGVIVKL